MGAYTTGMRTEASLDCEPLVLHGSGPLEIDTAALPDGPHLLTVTSSTPLRNLMSRTLRFVTDNSPPQVQWSQRTAQVEQGPTLPLVMRTDEPAIVTATFLERERTLKPVGERTLRPWSGCPSAPKPGHSPW